MAGHSPIELTESAKRKLPEALEARAKRKAGGEVSQIKRRTATRASRNRAALDAVNAALGIRRRNQTTDSNN